VYLETEAAVGRVLRVVGSAHNSSSGLFRRSVAAP